VADRAGGEGKPGVPKEVFELDKDERWQARLDEARARREVALREKAAGKPQKPRPKPWEVDGSSVEKPPVIDPVMQERGDDKFDFADRLETIREAKAEKQKSEPAPEPPRMTPRVTPVPEPTPAPPTIEAQTPEPPPFVKKAAPEARARPQPSLILPGAPDVADLAARYAATLDTPAPLTTREPTPPENAPEPERKTAELVALPTAKQSEPVVEPERPLSRADRRRGIRPLGMAVGLLGFAALPLTTEAPELEIGPEMPLVDVFRIQPALGVTWSLAEVPVLTTSVTWRPTGAPAALDPVLNPSSATAQTAIATLPLAETTLTGSLVWSEIAPHAVTTPNALPVPDVAVEPVSANADAPEPPSALPDVGDGSNATLPVETVAPTPRDTVPSLPEGGAGAPPRPATLQDNATPPAPPPPPANRLVPSETVVEADPLRVTILAPARVERALREDIAARIQSEGHELVRVRDIEFNISTRNVRYFHDGDRAAAERLAERYNAELRDFTWFRPSPVEGTAELWLAGRAPTGNTSGRVQPAAPSDQRDILERALERLGLGTDLPDALPGADVLRNVLPQRDN